MVDYTMPEAGRRAYLKGILDHEVRRGQCSNCLYGAGAVYRMCDGCSSEILAMEARRRFFGGRAALEIEKQAWQRYLKECREKVKTV